MEWEYYEVPLLMFRVKCKDGTYAYFGTMLVRRMLQDRLWEYRPPTPEEGSEYQARNAW